MANGLLPIIKAVSINHSDDNDDGELVKYTLFESDLEADQLQVKSNTVENSDASYDFHTVNNAQSRIFEENLS